MSPLNDNMVRVLRAIDTLEDAGDDPTPNWIGVYCGYRAGMAKMGKNSRRNGLRTMGEAVHVTPALTALTKRGLVWSGGRRDGYSGVAYHLTNAGRDALAANAHRVLPSIPPDHGARG